MPGMMPAMNSAPTDVLVATAYITITIDGGIRMPSAPEVVMTPAPKRGGKALLDHRRQEDRADRDDRRRRAARDGGEQRAGHDACQPETAVPVADHRRGEVDHPSRDAAVGQEVAGEDEERDRHDLEPLDAGEELQRDRLDRHVVIVNR